MAVFVICFFPFFPSHIAFYLIVFFSSHIVAPAMCVAELVGGHEEGREGRHVRGQVDGPQRNGIKRCGSLDRRVADADSQEGMGGKSIIRLLRCDM